MIYLIITICLVALIYHFDYRKHVRGRLLFYLIMWVIFIGVAGFRYRLGVDSVRYATYYTDLPDLSQLSNFDFTSTRYGRGYIFLSSIMRTISDDFSLMQFTLAFIVNSVLFLFFYKNTKNIFTCVLLYFLIQYFNYNFEILRESCAVAMFIIGWKYILKREWVKYYFCAICAALFHMSGVITLIIPLIFCSSFRKFFQINYLTPIIVLGLFLIGYVLSVYFFDLIRLLEFASVDNYADTYENSHYGEGKLLTPSRILAFIFKIVLCPLIIGWLLKKKRILNPVCDNEIYLDTLERMVVLYIYIYTLSYSLALLSRFNNYLAPFTILLIGDAFFYKIRMFKKRIGFSFGIWSIFFLVYVSPNILSLFNSVGDSNIPRLRRYYPYNSILFKETDETRERLYNYEGINRS